MAPHSNRLGPLMYRNWAFPARTWAGHRALLPPTRALGGPVLQPPAGALFAGGPRDWVSPADGLPGPPAFLAARLVGATSPGLAGPLCPP